MKRGEILIIKYNRMKKLMAFLLVMAFFIPIASTAHPGNTDSSGCHTCRTNCPSWGLSYGEYHCHNSKTTYKTLTTSQKMPQQQINITSDSYIDANYYNVCRIKTNADKYLYRLQGVNYYDGQCTMPTDVKTEKWIVDNGIASTPKQIHYWAYWLTKFKLEKK
jgi:hypothetical protein